MRGWTGRRGYGVKGGGGRGYRGRGTGEGGGERGERGRWFYTEICCILPILLNFYVLQCNNWVSEVYNRRTEANSGIFTMNRALISLRFTLSSFTSDF